MYERLISSLTNESNYKNKHLKLKNLDEKRTIVTDLIKQTLLLINIFVGKNLLNIRFAFN
jgi:hypothetical protein